jgi:hypothetical protein
VPEQYRNYDLYSGYKVVSITTDEHLTIISKITEEIIELDTEDTTKEILGRTGATTLRSKI